MLRRKFFSSFRRSGTHPTLPHRAGKSASAGEPILRALASAARSASMKHSGPCSTVSALTRGGDSARAAELEFMALKILRRLLCYGTLEHI